MQTLADERRTTVIRSFLVSAGVAQVDLARAIDVSPGFLNQVVAGRRRPSDRLRAAIADALGVDADSLFADSD